LAYHAIIIEYDYALAQSGGETSMPTRNVVLTAHHESVIEALVKSGRYQ
jgi:antitoxin ParD1/3/4